jgi:hypothetical protein
MNGIVDVVLRLFFRAPFRCMRCLQRFHRFAAPWDMRWADLPPVPQRPALDSAPVSPANVDLPSGDLHPSGMPRAS